MLGSEGGSSQVDDAGTPRNRIVAGFRAICTRPGIWDRPRVAKRRLAEACIQAGTFTARSCEGLVS
jgi:hypothetical protein